LPLVRRVVRLFKPYRRHVVLIGVAIFASTWLGVLNPLLIREIFDRALFCDSGCPKQSLLYALVVAMVVLAILQSAVGFFFSAHAMRVGQRVMRDLRDQMYASLKRRPFHFFTENRTGELQSRLTSDVGAVDDVVTNAAVSGAANVVIVASATIAMWLMSWELTIASLSIVPVFALATVWIGRRGYERWGTAQRAQAEVSAATQEGLSVSGALLSKVFGRDEDEIAQFRVRNAELTRLRERGRANDLLPTAVFSTFFQAAPAAVFLLIAWQLGSSGTSVSAGTIVAFTTLQARLFWPLTELFRYVVGFHSALAVFERIFEYVGEPQAEPDEGAPRHRAPVHGSVELQDVTFVYPGSAVPALASVRLLIDEGQFAAVVGPSGAGKTTLSYLVARLYDPTEGVVRIGGRDLRTIPRGAVASGTAVVTQETFLLHATIRENLRYARFDATDRQIEDAARAAFIHDRIRELPDGYETLVGERGYRLSGGERQRLAIARAILRDPRILILDEATASLDSTSERIVQRALWPLLEGRTAIVIAHRLSTLADADVIFVLDRGRLSETGRHDDLLEAGGLYASMYRDQTRSRSVV
jgi:ATP-binding cassette subfamily B protein